MLALLTLISTFWLWKRISLGKYTLKYLGIKSYDVCNLHSSSSVRFSRSVVSDSLQPHEWQHARPPCPSPTPGVYPNSCPLSWWCHPTISPSVVPSPPAPNPSQHQGLFQESALHMRRPKYWCFSFNISPSYEHPGLISFRLDWLDLFAVQGTLKSLLQHHS